MASYKCNPIILFIFMFYNNENVLILLIKKMSRKDQLLFVFMGEKHLSLLEKAPNVTPPRVVKCLRRSAFDVSGAQ